jgi:hypothetical protein
MSCALVTGWQPHVSHSQGAPSLQPQPHLLQSQVHASQSQAEPQQQWAAAAIAGANREASKRVIAFIMGSLLFDASLMIVSAGT